MLKGKQTTEVAKEKATKKTAKNNDKGILSGIMGIGSALVVVSSTYAVTVIALGTEGIVPLIMIAPLALTTAGVIIVAFYKLFK